MNICHVITNFANGGAEKMVVELANKQASMGNNVFIVIFDKIESFMIQNQNLNEVVDIKLIKRVFTFDFIVSFRLHSYLRKNNIDIVHTHKPSGIIHTLFTIFFSSRGVKFYHTVHNELSYYKNLYNRLKLFPVVSTRVFNICLTSKIASDYQLFFPIMNFTSIANGISIPKRSYDFSGVKSFFDKLKTNGNRVLLFIGRNSEQKNLKLLFETIQSINSQKIVCNLVCIGIEEKEIMSQYNLVRPVDEGIYILGSKPNIADYIINSDALVLSSKNEGMPLVIIEAMSLGKIVISTAVGGVPDMIKEGVNGFLSTKIDIPELSKAIQSFLSLSNENIRQISKNNIAKYKKSYSIESCADKHLSLYKNNYQ